MWIPEHVYFLWVIGGLVLGVAGAKVSRLGRLFILPALMLSIVLFPTLRQQIEAFGGPSLIIPNSPGTWIAVGWGFGFCMFRPSSIKKFLDTRTGILFGFFVLIAFLSGINGLATSLWLGNSHVSASGIINSLLLLPGFGPSDDFYGVQLGTVWLGAFAGSCGLFSIINTSSRREVQILMYWLGGSFLILALLAIAQHLTQKGFSRDHMLGVAATFPDLHALAGFLIVCMALTLGFVREEKSRCDRLFALLVSILLTFALFLTGSRATIFFASLIWLAWLFLQIKVNRSLKLIFLLMTFLAAFLALYNLDSRGTRVWQIVVNLANGNLLTQSVLFSYRPEIWQEALREWIISPVIGIGSGVFFKISGIQHFSISPFLKTIGGENAHSYFMQVLAENGAFGLLALCLILLAGLWRVAGNHPSRIVSWACLGVISANFYNHGMLTPENTILFGIVMVLSAARDSKSNLPVISSKFKYTMLGLSVFMIASFILIEGIRGHDEAKNIQGYLCQRDYGKTSDGWIGGRFAMRLSDAMPVRSIRLSTPVCNRFQDRHPLTLLKVIEDTRAVTKTIQIAELTSETTLNTADLGFTPRELYVERNLCFVPSNCGYSGDRRRLSAQFAISTGP